MRIIKVAALAVVAVFAVVAPASAKDYATTALNIIPSGQLETGQSSAPYSNVDGTKPYSRQADMYNGLTPLYRNVTPDDLAVDKFFKSEALDPTSFATEETPKPGVTIKRTSYGVPYVYGTTDDDVTWGAGWVAASDRSLLLNQARYNGLVAAIGVPGLSAIDLIRNLNNFKPSQQTIDIVAKQSAEIAKHGARGKQLLHDLDVYLEGINAWYAINSPTTPKFTRVDIYAINAVKGQFLGEGGGQEVSNSDMYDALTRKFGATKGRSMWDDLRERNDPDSVASVTDKSYPWQSQPKKFTGNVPIRNGSFVSSAPKTSAARATKTRSDSEHLASNILMVSGNRTATGHPLFVGGPQIGYFFPGLTYEIGLKGPHRNVVGATSAPFPGYMLIGRGEDFAWTLTSAGSDIIDQFAETLCGGSKTKYLYNGKCTKMGTVNAGTLTVGSKDIPVTFNTTVHGPVTGYAKTAKGGKTIALAAKRSSYGKDTVDQLFNQSLTDGSVKSFADFKKAAEQTPQTFNSFYADHKHIGFYTSGLLPMRPKDTTGDLPINGEGKHEWTGFLAASKHAQGYDPKSGVIVNWNNKPAKDYPASDERWDEAPIQRQQMLTTELNRNAQNTLATVTGAMNAAATNDVRAVVFQPTLAAMLSKAPAPNARDAQMLTLLNQWHVDGGSRLDGNGDGLIDEPGAAIMDQAFEGMAKEAMCPRLTTTICTLLANERAGIFGTSQYGGWHQYMQKDFKTILGVSVKQKYSTRYCGLGDAKKCATEMWKEIDDAGNRLQTAQGADPTAWHASATAEQISFGPLPLIKMAWTNRPSGIQQIISFDGHR